jgi:ankyrin repeat protein
MHRNRWWRTTAALGIACLALALSVPMGLVAQEKADSKELNEKLKKAWEKNDRAAIKDLLDKGADPNITIKLTTKASDVPFMSQKSRFPLLYLAVANDDIALMNLLLDHGADVNATTTDGFTPLMNSGLSGVATKLLLEHGANPNAVTNEGQTALMIADYRYRGSFPFQINAEAENTALLLKAGAAPCAKNNLGRTALTNAVYQSNPQKLALLLSAGCGPDAADNDGMTPLMEAVTIDTDGYGRRGPLRDMIRLLLSKGASPTLQNKKGKSSIDIVSDVEWRAAGRHSYLLPLLKRAAAGEGLALPIEKKIYAPPPGKAAVVFFWPQDGWTESLGRTPPITIDRVAATDQRLNRHVAFLLDPGEHSVIQIMNFRVYRAGPEIKFLAKAGDVFYFQISLLGVQAGLFPVPEDEALFEIAKQKLMEPNKVRNAKLQLMPQP